jgi:hypothetical protein
MIAALPRARGFTRRWNRWTSSLSADHGLTTCRCRCSGQGWCPPAAAWLPPYPDEGVQRIFLANRLSAKARAAKLTYCVHRLYRDTGRGSLTMRLIRVQPIAKIDSTARAERGAQPPKRKRGRPRKGEVVEKKEPRRLERQADMSLAEMLSDLPTQARRSRAAQTVCASHGSCRRPSTRQRRLPGSSIHRPKAPRRWPAASPATPPSHRAPTRRACRDLLR